MSANYCDVEDGSKSTVTCYPAGFDFDSRIKKFNSVVIKQLEEIKRKLESNTPGNSKEADAVAQSLKHVIPQGQYLGCLLYTSDAADE